MGGEEGPAGLGVDGGRVQPQCPPGFFAVVGGGEVGACLAVGAVQRLGVALLAGECDAAHLQHGAQARGEGLRIAVLCDFQQGGGFVVLAEPGFLVGG
ncbi:hypothetical protein ABT115_15840 [Streptomyces sp. NPDC001832]|uniref:hypothetical protein n=1 Tax=Streptomyces sp. NPDC001832 TaxID=3154527 RepID=UPI003326A5EE